MEHLAGELNRLVEELAVGLRGLAHLTHVLRLLLRPDDGRIRGGGGPNAAGYIPANIS